VIAGDIEALGNRRGLAVRHLGEARHLVALPLGGDADGAYSGGIQMLTPGQSVDDEVEGSAPVIKGGAVSASYAKKTALCDL